MGYNLDPISDNCYPGTSILINKFNIRDENKLNEAETAITSARNTEWLSQSRMDTFNFCHYKTIHFYLFSDLYNWAGQIRTVNISKKGTRFCPAQKIEEHAALIFKRLKEQKFFHDLQHDEFVDEITDFYNNTNFLHPFREGNGRTQRTFLTQLIRYVGYNIDWSAMDTDLLMIATIQAANGVTDLLRRVLSEGITKNK